MNKEVFDLKNNNIDRVPHTSGTGLIQDLKNTLIQADMKNIPLLTLRTFWIKAYALHEILLRDRKLRHLMKKELNPNQELDASEKDKLYRFRKFLSEKGDEKSNSLFLEYLKEFPIALRHKDHFDFDFSAFLEFVKNTENPTDQKQAFCLILDPDFTFYVDHNARTNYAIKNDCIVEFIRLMEEAISSTSEKKAGRPKLQEPEKLTERVNLRFSEAEYQKLEQQALKQHLPVTTFARKLVLDALATVQPDNAP